MKYILVLLGLLVTPACADDGIITKPSKYSVIETISRFEAAVKSRESAGFTVFTEIDHAAAGKKFGIDMRPRTVVIFGNPKLGTPVMTKTPTIRRKLLFGRMTRARFGCLTIQPTISTKRFTPDMERRRHRTTRRSRNS